MDECVRDSNDCSQGALMRFAAFMLAMLIAGSALAARPDGEVIGGERTTAERQLVERVKKIMPVPINSIRRITDDASHFRAYIITFDFSEVPRAPHREISTAIQFFEGDGEEKMNAALHAVASDMWRVLDNLKSGRAWNEGVQPPRPLGIK